MKARALGKLWVRNARITIVLSLSVPRQVLESTVSK